MEDCFECCASSNVTCAKGVMHVSALKKNPTHLSNKADNVYVALQMLQITVNVVL